MAVDQVQVKGGGHWLVTLGQVKGGRHWLVNTANSINVVILIRNIIITLSYFLIFNGTQELNNARQCFLDSFVHTTY